MSHQQAEPYGGYPYLMTLLDHDMAHIQLLPTRWSIAKMVRFAFVQKQRNNLRMCLALTRRAGHYLSHDRTNVKHAPTVQRWVTGHLMPHTPVRFDDEMWIRLLHFPIYKPAFETPSWIESENLSNTIKSGYVPKFGRIGSEEEMQRLSRKQSNGVPTGLAKCLRCGDWRGECLDPDYSRVIVRIFCRCQNNTCCAACGQSLAARRLCSCYFDEEAHQVKFISGLDGLAHAYKCGALLVKKRAPELSEGVRKFMKYRELDWTSRPLPSNDEIFRRGTTVFTLPSNVARAMSEFQRRKQEEDSKADRE